MSFVIIVKKIPFAVVFIALALCGARAFAAGKHDANSLISSMRERNPAVISGRLALEQADLDVSSAIGNFMPKIAYGANAYYIANPPGRVTLDAQDALSLSGWSQGASASMPGNYATIYDGMDNSHYSFSLGFVQPVSTWGKLSSNLRIAKALRGVQSDRVSQIELQSEMGIRAAVESLSYLDEMSSVLSEAESQADELVKLAEAVRSAQMAVDKDVLSALSVASAIRYAKAKCDMMVSNSLMSLRSISGISDLALDDIERSPSSFDDCIKLLSQDELSLVSGAISPEKAAIIISDRMKDIAGGMRAISGASALYAPDLMLVGGVSYSGSRFPFVESGWYGEDRWNAVLGLRLSGTLFDGGNQFFRIRRDDLQIMIAENDAERTVDGISNEVRSLRSQLNTSVFAIRFKQAESDEKRELLRIAEEGLSNGSVSRLEYLRSSLESARSEADLLSERIRCSTCYWTLMTLI